MKTKFGKRVFLAFVATIIIVAALGLFSYVSTHQLIKASSLLTHSLSVTNNADIVLKSILDIETGERGFVISGDEDFLDPYRESEANIHRHIKTLDSLTASDHLQQLGIDSLKHLLERELAYTNEVIALRRISFEKAQDLVSKKQGKNRVDSIRAIIRRLKARESDNFQGHNIINTESLRNFQYSFVGFSLSILAIIGVLFYVISQAFKVIRKSEADARQSSEKILRLNQELETRVEERTKELIESQRIYKAIATNIPGSAVVIFDSSRRYIFAEGSLLTQLGYTKEELVNSTLSEVATGPALEQYNALLDAAFSGATITREIRTQSGNYTLMRVTPLRGTHEEIFGALMVLVDINEVRTAQQHVADLNKTLESKVLLRTEQLDRVNKELESFTYSVSHDLRSPLRSITGYAQILKEDAGANLSKENQQALDIVMRNALRMGTLIDDLLEFSRMGRKHLANATLDMNSVAKSALDEVASVYQNTNTAIKIGELLPCKGDNSMIRQVWVNLISNAYKYSGKKIAAEIEIGCFTKGNSNVYFVRDNGAGFDMQYSSKLFGVFQRLHKMKEFEGTGVGLALVKTIISRHNGAVWAEAKLNEGATFFFSLPNS